MKKTKCRSMWITLNPCLPICKAGKKAGHRGNDLRLVYATSGNDSEYRKRNANEKRMAFVLVLFVQASFLNHVQARMGRAAHKWIRSGFQPQWMFAHSHTLSPVNHINWILSQTCSLQMHCFSTRKKNYAIILMMIRNNQLASLKPMCKCAAGLTHQRRQMATQQK